MATLYYKKTKQMQSELRTSDAVNTVVSKNTMLDADEKRYSKCFKFMTDRCVPIVVSCV
jgi:hypothetical protein